ncbi:MAG TPA: glycoside hydrolase family 57 protein [Methylophilaceae bacterium]|nr:glycoside hydrolase family 57 protein [Methylophilaceae bacterium]
MTAASPTLYLNLYWHMHQPDYRDTLSHEFVLPWTYLHAIKDYTDMAFHLEANPKARATFNFVPILLDQLDDYARQFAQNDIRDPLLAMLAERDIEHISAKQRMLIIDSCFKNYHEKMLEPFPHYQKLHLIYRTLAPEGNVAFDYLSGQYMADLLVWYHLAWTGETVRRSSPLVQHLMEKGSQFTLDDRLALHALIGELITELIRRYKALHASGQIEVSTTPYYHPILPLLLDFKCTRDAMPYAPLPHCGQYPGGRMRASAHIEEALASHSRRFGKTPRGMWPAEGGVSHAALALMAEHGVQWAATGEGVLANSLYKSFNSLDLPPRNAYLYKPYRVTDGGHEIICFFRDEQLSDKIGFEYSKWHSTEAVHDFMQSLEHIRQNATPGCNPVVSVILDGENAWEYYPYNGYYFLSELYEALTSHPDIEMTTFCDILDKLDADAGIELRELPAIAGGSWVYGSFSTWIGSTEKNLAWDLLCQAKKQYDRVMATDALTESEKKACEQQLSICEGSDWFWWFGDYNPSDSVESFDRLYRLNLSNLYRLLKLEVPPILSQPISHGGGQPAAGGTMRRGQEEEKPQHD